MLKKLILNLYQTSSKVVGMQTNGLTHADSLLQPAMRGNCLNWVVGHIVATREDVLEIVGQEPLWNEAEKARYVYGSEPIISADDPAIIPLERMLADLKTGLQRLEDGLAEMSEAQLMQTNEKGNTVAERLHFLGWHEGYHAGQTEYLRQLTGCDDKMI